MTVWKANKEKLLDIIDSLQPITEEYADNERFFYWMDYACELDVLSILVYGDSAMSYLKERLQKGLGGPELDAVNDFVLTANERGYEIV